MLIFAHFDAPEAADMKRQRIGNTLLVIGVILLLFVLIPIFWHLGHRQSSLKPDIALGLTALDNCYGRICYVTPLDMLIERATVIIAPITLVLCGLGYFLSMGRRAGPPG